MAEVNAILHERYLLLSKLGRGGMGIVFKAVDRKQDKECAIKEIIIRGMDPDEVLCRANEIIFLKTLKHENILTCYEHFHTKDYLYIVTEFCKDNDLESLIKHAQAKNMLLKPDQIMDYTEQLLNGLNYLHKQNIIHRDIKPDNIFRNGEILKIGDLGIAKNYNFTQKQTRSGTECYQAPEFFKEFTVYGYESDIWSLGVTLYELCTLQLPFKSPEQVLSKYLNFDDLPQAFPKHMKKAIKRMLTKEQKERPTAEQLILWFENAISAEQKATSFSQKNHHTNTSNSTNTTITNANQIDSTVKSNNINQINSGSSSPTSRSHSISSDDHGIGSASLSQLSGSPNIEYAYPRKRLYASIPDRKFICIKGYKPVQPGELELKKGDIIEILSVGEQGFWEGRSRSSEGWFPSDCVEEIQLPRDYNDSLVVKRKTLLNLITQSDYNTPRTVVLQRGKKGYGFVLRGAKVTDKKFEPTAEIPALQFLESVDIGSNADKAGLKSLDFVLEINGVDVTCRTHDECVKLIKKSGETLVLKVFNVNDI